MWLSPGIVFGEVSGTIVASATHSPIAGARILVECQGIQKGLPSLTDETGSFAFAGETLFEASSLLTPVLTLEVFAPGYHLYHHLLRPVDDGVFVAAGLRIELERDGSAAGLSASEQERLLESRSSEGNTLFLLPYAGSMTTPTGIPLESELPWMLDIGVNTHFQRLNAPNVPAISVQPVDVGVSGTNAEAIREAGHYLNALGMVSGTGGVSGSHLRLYSKFTIVPSIEDEFPGSIIVVDEFPAENLSAIDHANRISTYWAHNTALAVAVRELRDSRSSEDLTRLSHLHDFLVAEKASLGPDDANLARQFDKLMAIVREGLHP